MSQLDNNEQQKKPSDSSGQNTGRRGRVENLRPWQPGQSGNPGGRKKKPITELYERWLRDPSNESLILEYVEKVLSGDRMVGQLMLREMAERVEGRVTQPIELEGKVSISERVARAKKKLEGGHNTPEE